MVPDGIGAHHLPLVAVVIVVHRQAVSVGPGGIADGDIHGSLRVLFAGPVDVQQDQILLGGHGVGPLGPLGDGDLPGQVLARLVGGADLGGDAGGDVRRGVGGGAVYAVHDVAAEQLPDEIAQRRHDHQQDDHQHGDLPLAAAPAGSLRVVFRLVAVRRVIVGLIAVAGVRPVFLFVSAHVPFGFGVRFFLGRSVLRQMTARHSITTLH